MPTVWKRIEGEWVKVSDLIAAEGAPCDGCGKSRGLGDTIAKLTSAVGITPCGGCKERQEALNRLVPYKGTP